MTMYHIVMFESIADKCAQIPRKSSHERLPSPALSIINTNYSQLEQEAVQLPFHLTSFPPVAVTVLFILCFFLYVLCSHVDSYKHPSCLSRIEPIHHEHFKQLASLSELNSLSLLHLSWFPCVREAAQSTLAHSGTHQHLRVLSSMFPGCTAAFLCYACWKHYLCTDNISYIPCLLNAEVNHCMWSSQGPWWLRVKLQQCKGRRIPSKMKDYTVLHAQL